MTLAGKRNSKSHQHHEVWSEVQWRQTFIMTQLSCQVEVARRQSKSLEAAELWQSNSAVDLMCHWEHNENLFQFVLDPFLANHMMAFIRVSSIVIPIGFLYYVCKIRNSYKSEIYLASLLEFTIQKTLSPVFWMGNFCQLLLSSEPMNHKPRIVSNWTRLV